MHEDKATMHDSNTVHYLTKIQVVTLMLGKNMRFNCEHKHTPREHKA